MDWEVMRIATTEWRDFLRNFNLIKLDYSTVNLTQVMQWYDSITPPFREGKKRKEFPDAFAIAIIEEYARKTGTSIAVVSEDSDMKLACDRFAPLLYFKSLPTLTELLLSDDNKLNNIRESIKENIDSVEERCAEIAADIYYYHSNEDYDVKRTKIHGFTIEDMNIVAIGAGECTITFDGTLEAEHLLNWKEWDRHHEEYYLEDEWILETCSLSGTAKVTLDSKTNVVNEITFFELDTADIAVIGSPRHRW